MERVQISISVLRTFKQLFHTYCRRIPNYYKNSQNIKFWDFPATLVFKRSDRIMERLLMIEVCGVSEQSFECVLYRNVDMHVGFSVLNKDIRTA